ncbi:TPA: helix-turn-helix domain-containing protein [Pseudomonas aeruginosa]|uniref:helix-turn-helix domain-containing protein n=1 Tax=Pseudomonas TaxID=286 RepID=UPI0003B96E0A|nr:MULTISPECIES: helix-turn-helix transcriptional regulator [Pseudomonas]ANA72311.1 XRE family transcriptional regulator [Pseudomonas aeruginosa]EIW4145341.1 XRE family transcriptional regulator [Pseudomonas aeruginosa]EKU5858136.1 XRE family transcriptional regulator [Pseudomonas aeruginosa]EMB0804801.1 XRE family transcriptional regulator [Pseudomonas aeruginosa]ERX99997.1 hypothetical protein Q079_00296 [Pseudomonas aeruginosa BL25]
MSKEPIEIVRGSGNVYRDMGYADSDARQLKAILGAEIIKVLDKQGLSVRQAQEQTGFNAADFSRIRKAKLDRFSIDRLMGVLNALGARVDVRVRVKPETPPSMRP